MNDNQPELGEIQIDGRTRSGKARMAKMTIEERRALAKRAAAARWADELEVKRATHEGVLLIGNIEIPCAVLQDGSRVLNQGGFLKAIGRNETANTGRGNTGKAKTAPFLRAENLTSVITDELREECVPFAFRMDGQRFASWGYRAELLPRVCEVYLRARDQKLILPAQAHIVTACDVLMRGLAQVGILALVDEATGYQRDRAKDALAQILAAFIAKELQPYIKTFPAEYYENLFRLRQIEYSAESVKRPQYFGVLTNDIVYSRLAPGVLEELKKEIPRYESGRPKAKYFQRLTTNVGYPKLREHLGKIVAFMQVSKDYPSFMALMNQHCPRQKGQFLLPLEYDETADNGRGI